MTFRGRTMASRLIACVILCAVLIVAAACARPLRVVCAGSVEGTCCDHVSRLRHATYLETSTFRCQPDDARIAFSMRSRLTQGRVAWVLLDPRGQVRWSSLSQVPFWFRRTRRLEPIPGEWELKVAVVNATGEYRAAWCAE